MTDKELASELTVTACAVSVAAALEALDIATHKMNGLKWGALGQNNTQAFDEFERMEQAFKMSHSSLSKSLQK